MKFENWKIESIANILPEEFFKLITKNKNHIEKTFPVTVSNCLDLDQTNNFIATNIDKEAKSEGYYYYIRNTETNIFKNQHAFTAKQIAEALDDNKSY